MLDPSNYIGSLLFLVNRSIAAALRWSSSPHSVGALTCTPDKEWVEVGQCFVLSSYGGSESFQVEIVFVGVRLHAAPHPYVRHAPQHILCRPSLR